MLDYALELARRGFYVFPVRPGGKVPAVVNWPNLATREQDDITAFWVNCPPMEEGAPNIGIATGRFGDGQALLVVDIDNKKGKSGDSTIFELELQGCDFPTTMEVTTPSGGRHLYYVVEKPVRQGVNVLGEGVYERSRGGFVVGPGSQIDGRSYTLVRRTLPVPAPAWLVARCGVEPDRVPSEPVNIGGVDPARAAARAIEYLKTAPIAIEGQGGDLTTYKVAAKLKDYGLTEKAAVYALAETWNPRCQPPWPEDDLEAKVAHAYRYGREPAGVAAPEAVFTKGEQDEEGEHPADALNKEYAFIKRG
ncbi:MAG: bifunctional DNA primase/polymerase, partial [Chromatiaceae bacterium]|nr:bifunctional DNA primase/polymerase [Candidatus Thioaporhodococcus sediminis]